MTAKPTELFKEALAHALKGRKEETQEYLHAYETRILRVAENIDKLKRELKQLEDEHTAVCVVFGANKK